MKRKKVILVIYPEFSEFEVCLASQILSSHFDIVPVGLTKEVVVSEVGLRYIPDLTVDQVRVSDYEAILVPGAKDMVVADGQESLYALVRTFNEQKKIIASICGGPMILQRAGVLHGKSYTVTFDKDARKFLGFDESYYVWAPVVESANIITAQVHALVDFAIATAKKLGIPLSQDVLNFFRGEHELIRPL